MHAILNATVQASGLHISVGALCMGCPVASCARAVPPNTPSPSPGNTCNTAPFLCCAQVLVSNVFHDSRVVNGLVSELALWFLIYTESSSMRHTSELMWFIYWCCAHSYVMAEFWHRDLPEPELGACTDCAAPCAFFPRSQASPSLC